MLPEDFYDFKSKLSKGKDTCYPYLDDVVVTKFEKGFTGIFWKTDMQATEFQYGEFLQKKVYKGLAKFCSVSTKTMPTWKTIASERRHSEKALSFDGGAQPTCVLGSSTCS